MDKTMTEEELRNPPPTVIAIMATMILEIPKQVKHSRVSAPVLLERYWSRIVDEMVK